MQSQLLLSQNSSSAQSIEAKRAKSSRKRGSRRKVLLVGAMSHLCTYEAMIRSGACCVFFVTDGSGGRKMSEGRGALARGEE